MTSPIKPDEVALRRLVIANGGKIPSSRWEALTRRDHAMIDKWLAKGWWDFGVSPRAGWLTPKGIEAFAAWAEHATLTEPHGGPPGVPLGKSGS